MHNPSQSILGSSLPSSQISAAPLSRGSSPNLAASYAPGSISQFPSMTNSSSSLTSQSPSLRASSSLLGPANGLSTTSSTSIQYQQPAPPIGIPADEFMGYMAQFASLDSDADGFLSGADGRVVLSKSVRVEAFSCIQPWPPLPMLTLATVVQYEYWLQITFTADGVAGRVCRRRIFGSSGRSRTGLATAASTVMSLPWLSSLPAAAWPGLPYPTPFPESCFRALRPPLAARQQPARCLGWQRRIFSRRRRLRRQLGRRLGPRLVSSPSRRLVTPPSHRPPPRRGRGRGRRARTRSRRYTPPTTPRPRRRRRATAETGVGG